jgi:hypothetical protein
MLPLRVRGWDGMGWDGYMCCRAVCCRARVSMLARGRQPRALPFKIICATHQAIVCCVSTLVNLQSPMAKSGQTLQAEKLLTAKELESRRKKVAPWNEARAFLPHIPDSDNYPRPLSHSSTLGTTRARPP